MADFHTALKRTLALEGGYAHTLGDRGGETYRGISRNNWPAWPGWKMLDEHLGAGHHPDSLDQLPWLATQVEGFYRANFWRPLLGDGISRQAVADELFDSAVNCGMGRAVRWLQQALNMVGAHPLQVDGVMGPQTLGAVTACRYEQGLIKAQNGFQFGHYCDIIKHDALQARFFRSWLRRV